MKEFLPPFSDAGNLQLIILIPILGSLVFSVLQIARRGRADLTAPIVGLIATAFFLSLVNYASGIYTASRTIACLPQHSPLMIFVAQGAVLSTIGWTAMLCAVCGKSTSSPGDGAALEGMTKALPTRL